MYKHTTIKPTKHEANAYVVHDKNQLPSNQILLWTTLNLTFQSIPCFHWAKNVQTTLEDFCYPTSEMKI